MNTWSNYNVRVRTFSCKKHPNRNRVTEESVRRENVNFSLINCMGSEMSIETLRRFTREGVIDKHSSISKSEVGEIVTHASAWSEFLENKTHDLLLVIGDRVKLHHTFVQKMKSILKAITEENTSWNGVYFFINPKSTKSIRVVETSPKLELREILGVKKTTGHTCISSCYIINRTFATYLLNIAFPIKTKLDTLLMSHYHMMGNICYTVNHYQEKRSDITPLMSLIEYDDKKVYEPPVSELISTDELMHSIIFNHEKL
jgi:GR25 family glycosyltransferase involved in LPS biosynthesis